ncbi:hypothetical protein QLG07_02500 [Erwinia sp. V90_4]|uniref:hypothetical protein n=1 Tax=Erwinia sp. V90_4 TaxID=3044239 RepID=UPI00249F2B6B|nr:hypothetical protein [Erwinia sp. V90_4]MDI3438328.1 hypothetical protein [Erwinia sp. V90_4]
MINELIEQIGGRERLEFIAGNAISRERSMMASALLAVLDAKPIAYMHHSGQVVTREECCDDKVFSICCKVETPLYTTPPAASVPDVNFDLSKPGTEATVITHYQVPDGWKLVPLKAFPSQWAAGQKAFDAAGINKIDPVYHAMVEAAPSPGGDGR